MRRPRWQDVIRRFPENGIKVLLHDPANVRDLLSLAQPDLVPRIDFARLASLPSSFVARDWRHLEADLLLTAPLTPRGGQRGRSRVWLYLLIEHQSQPDRMMPLRLLEYLVQVFKSQLRQWERNQPSSAHFRGQPVLPVVLYTGQQPWRSVGRLVDLIEMGGQFTRVTPDFEPLFVSLPAVPEDRLEQQGGAFGRVLQLVKGKGASAAEFVWLLEEVLQGLEGVAAEDVQRWRVLLSYLSMLVYHERQEREHGRLVEVIQEAAAADPERREVQAMARTIAEAMIAKGRKEGRQEGRKEGRMEGRQEEAVRSRQQTLLRLLRKRFGDVPEAVAEQVNATRDIGQLDAWLDGVVTAARLDDVGVLPAR